MEPWMWWVAAALILGVVETQTTALVAAMLAGGALAGAAASAAGAPGGGQVAAFALVSALLLLLVRPVARRHLKTPVELRTGVAALIGKDALVLETVDGQGGRVKIGGEVWSARAYSPGQDFAVGSTVQVLTIEGATALVA